MTTVSSLVYYPQYCFHLSRTINTWCPLRTSDIVALGCQPGFEDIDVFFHLNHPIRWVRITGVVVAIDDYYGHRVYTIDDSTGKCIECVLATTKATSDKTNRRDLDHGKIIEPSLVHTKTTTKALVTKTGTTDLVPTIQPPLDINVGTVLDVKGGLKLYRGQIQIKIQKATPVLSTNQEVLFWDKTRDFLRDVLAQPWVLTDKEVRRCRKLQQVEAIGPREKRRERAGGQAEGEDESRGQGTARIHTSDGCRRLNNGVSGASVKMAKAQRAAMTEALRSKIGDGDKYDALGL